MRLHGKPGVSQVVHSAVGADCRADKQASSPSGKREKSVNSGRDKRLEYYDPVPAEKQVVRRVEDSQSGLRLGNNRRDQQERHSAGHGHQPRGPTPNTVAGQQGVGRNPLYQGKDCRQNRYDDGYSAMGRERDNLGPLGARVGNRQVSPLDARHQLDKIYLSELLEEQGPPGMRCFAHRIMRETPAYGFQLCKGTRTYDGSTKPEDWLEDYVTAVHVAGGNHRWAVRYVPQMLVGPARIWLNNLPEGSINCWIDFEEAFVSNFTSTYKRPNRPQQLSMCKQRDNETDRDYLTRWNNLRNSCEGIVESQAIAWFAQGCRHDNMLWQKLQKEMPATLSEMIKIADMYALGDPTQPSMMPAEPQRE